MKNGIIKKITAAVLTSLVLSTAFVTISQPVYATEAETETETEAEEFFVKAEDTAEGDLMFPEIDTRILEEEEYNTLTKEEVKIAMNEIYARHGFIFLDEMLNEHFSAFEWYQPVVEDAVYLKTLFNENELENLARLGKYNRTLR